MTFLLSRAWRWLLHVSKQVQRLAVDGNANKTINSSSHVEQLPIVFCQNRWQSYLELQISIILRHQSTSIFIAEVTARLHHHFN